MTSPQVMALTVVGATKRFGDSLALDDVNLNVAEGTVCALVGANGSGKSTLIKALAGYHILDAGIVKLHGQELNAHHVGEQTSWHDPAQSFVFESRYVDELKALRVAGPAQPHKYFLVAAQGDEVLDWREMTGRYPGVRLRLLQGSDHALSDFDRHIDDVIRFLDLA